MTKILAIKNLLQQSTTIPKERHSAFFKTGAGHYAEHDQFIGVKVPTLRVIAKNYKDLPLPEIQILLDSPINEERLLALFILVAQYKKANDNLKDELYQFYMNNLKQVNNWNLVDASAHLIIGAHLLKRDRGILFSLGQSELKFQPGISFGITILKIRLSLLKSYCKINMISFIKPLVGCFVRQGKSIRARL